MLRGLNLQPIHVLLIISHQIVIILTMLLFIANDKNGRHMDTIINDGWKFFGRIFSSWLSLVLIKLKLRANNSWMGEIHFEKLFPFIQIICIMDTALIVS